MSHSPQERCDGKGIPSSTREGAACHLESPQAEVQQGAELGGKRETQAVDAPGCSQPCGRGGVEEDQMEGREEGREVASLCRVSGDLTRDLIHNQW